MAVAWPETRAHREAGAALSRRASAVRMVLRDRRAINQRFLLFRKSPEPRPGSTVVVPEVPVSELIPFNAMGFATTAVGLLSSLATLLVLLNQLEN